MSENQDKKKAKMALEKLKESDNRTDFRVYDCPVELKNELISMAKLHYDNEMWKVLADALELLKKEKDGELENRFADLEGRISRLEEEVHVMKMMDKHTTEKSDEPDRKLGFGESKPSEKDDIDALKDITGED